MKGSVSINILFPDEKSAKDAHIALEKEMNSNKRFTSKITINNTELIVLIEGEDMVALRATSNSFLRYLKVIEDLRR